MEPTTTNILLIMLGAVSGIVIIILIVIGIQVARLLSAIHRITSVFADEADHVRHVGRKIREKFRKAFDE